MRNIINDIVLISHVEIMPVVVGGLFLCSGSKCTNVQKYSFSYFLKENFVIIHDSYFKLKLTDNLMNTMMSFPLSVNNPLSNIR